MAGSVRKELLQAGRAEGVAAVDEDSGDSVQDIVGEPAEFAAVFIE